MYLQELEACRGEVEQVDNGFGRGFVRGDSVKIQSKAAPSLSDFVANISNRLKRTLLLALAHLFWHFAWYGVVANSQVACLFSSKHWECKHDKMRCLPRKRGYLQLDRKLIFSSASSFDGNVRAIKCPRLGFKLENAALLCSVDICTLACHALGRAWQKIIQHDVCMYGCFLACFGCFHI